MLFIESDNLDSLLLLCDMPRFMSLWPEWGNERKQERIPFDD